ncbi:MAG: ABC transporter permease [Candidatus Omnitrophota bacterium]|nr:ABC transporter permease [Candidatus Omnitrophota bacterium]
MKRIYDFFTHREILKNLVLRNLRVRYKGSILGFFWVLLNPLLTMLVLYVVFSQIMRIEIQQYPLFLLSALLPWTFFSSSLTDAACSIIDNANLVKKVYFPREILPVSYVLSNFINLLFSLLALLFILLIFRIQALRFIYFLPLILIIHLIFTIGLALLLSCANVYFRDVSHILGIILMFWFYLTPVFYSIDMVPQNFRSIYLLNPMVSIITMYRNVLFEGKIPGMINILIVMLVIIITLLFGYFVFKRYEPSFAKEV